jgi:hypothetical protein
MASGPGVASAADAAANASSQPAAPVSAPDPMRAYRACIHCRNRKTKCTLDINGGRPVSLACLLASYCVVALPSGISISILI